VHDAFCYSCAAQRYQSETNAKPTQAAPPAREIVEQSAKSVPPIPNLANEISADGPAPAVASRREELSTRSRELAEEEIVARRQILREQCTHYNAVAVAYTSKPSDASIANSSLSTFGAKDLPRNVQLFEQLMYLASMLAIVATALTGFPPLWNENPFAAVVAFILVIVFWLWIWRFFITQTTRQHRNWARWVWLTLGVGNLMLAVADFQQDGWLDGLFVLAIALTWAAAVFFVFTGDARSWFENGPTS
jgi:hypothetical protein